MHAEAALPGHHHDWIIIDELPLQLLDGTAVTDWLGWRPGAQAMAFQAALLHYNRFIMTMLINCFHFR